ncbi:hypothetical protein CYLTODRAFT_440920 [Cylindrobasidium torrendii FP15055 ss-10]|uniref:BTB domain-containing protein n=1 Tax=Cylindrobasidium torrendii FP15055 ss-10 TaxID=1314674 RepID=A0A0D7BP43_9AGAR|nr:hypothetical protein CYLTODRAFT_440920 [Cylindrobasidium torrendii FP15055 ss-10]
MGEVPQKRKPDHENSEQPAKKTAVGLTRDHRFFYEDGNCVLRVEDVLFKVHRSVLLLEEGSVFHDLFKLPQPSGNEVAEGTSEEFPIVLQGDTVSQFSNLLFTFYSRPYQLADMQKAVCLPTVASFMDVAELAHKYGMPRTYNYAINVIFSQCRMSMRMNPSPLLSALTVDAAANFMRRVGHVLSLEANPTLISGVLPMLSPFFDQSPKYAYISMELSDRYALGDTDGAYALMTLPLDATFAISPNVPVIPGAVDGRGRLALTLPQRSRLLEAYRRIMDEWPALVKRGAEMVSAHDCARAIARSRQNPTSAVSQATGNEKFEDCEADWDSIWKRACDRMLLANSHIDTLQRLKALVPFLKVVAKEEDEIDLEGSKPCWNEVVHTVDALIAQLMANLPKMFLPESL